MKLSELAYAVWASKVLIFVENEKESFEFRSSEFRDTGSAMRKACQEFGDRFVTCIFPLSQSEMTITIR